MKKKDIYISLVIIAVSGGMLYFYTRRMGYLQIDAGTTDAILQLQSSLFSRATVHSDQTSTPVHARIHRPQHIRLSIDQDGHNYFILSRGPWGNLAKIKVKNNQTTIIRLGPPLMIKPKVQKRKSVVEIQFDIFGQAGEQYEKFVRKDNRVVAGASVEIVDEKGSVLDSGKFRYG